jgi:hypothetical protein
MLTSKEIFDVLAACKWKPEFKEHHAAMTEVANKLASAIRSKDPFFDIESFLSVLGYSLTTPVGR